MSKRSAVLMTPVARSWVAAAILSFVAVRSLGAAMVDPAIDDPNREWCYLAKSTTVIGVPLMPDAVQVTFDGAVYTRQAELCFFYGERQRPLLARQKTFLEGWIPIVQYGWQEGAICYELEMFGAVLDGESAANTVQFARVRMRNTSAQSAKAAFTSALRHSGEDGRSGGSAFSPAWTYAMNDRATFRDGRMVYCFPPGGRRERVPGLAYEEAFVGLSEFVTPRSEVCLVRYEPILRPGEQRELVFEMPRVPVPAEQADLVARIAAADYALYREKTVRFWKELLAGGAEFDIPEARVNAAWRASLVHLLLATRQRDGERFQTSGLPYPDFFMIDFVDMRLAYDGSGHPGFSEQSFPQILKRQLDDGLFCDTSLSHGAKLWSSHGHMVYALTHHYLMTRDEPYARNVFPAVRRAVEWMRQARASDECGLMPPAWPYDAEMIQGRYTSHNLWSLLGLRTAIQMARAVGHEEEASQWLELHEDYRRAFLEALRASAGHDGYVPTGLGRFVTGPQARDGFAEFQTDQDWENMLLVYPTEVLGPSDPRVSATLSAIRRDRYREGIMTYRNGRHLHQYVTANLIEQSILLGEAERALRDFYHLLLHSGSTHEGFENMVEPWQDRRVTIDCPPPHAWAAAKIVQLARNMLVVEYGGRAGLDSGERDLHLFSVISPAWVVAGKDIAVRDAPTEMGKISARIQFTAGGADVSICGRFHHPPRELVIAVPWFVELVSFTSDARRSRREGDVIRLSPDATRLSLQWRERPDVHHGTFQNLLLSYRREVGFWDGRRHEAPAPPAGFLTPQEEQHGPDRLSFETVLSAYRHEYVRRFGEELAKGTRPVEVAAPAMLTAEQRRAAFEQRFGKCEPNLATGKPATASSALADYPASYAVDGNSRDLLSSWQADPYPQWWQVDLEKVETIDRLHVVPYWGGGRVYRYTVEASVDGKTWSRIADLSRNARPATPDGDQFRFPPVDARYVRVNLLYHSLNRGVHLVEVRVFPTKGESPRQGQ